MGSLKAREGCKPRKKWWSRRVGRKRVGARNVKPRETPAAWWPPELTQNDLKEAQTRTLGGPWFEPRPQFHEKALKDGKKKQNSGLKRGGKSDFGPPTLQAHNLLVPTLLGPHIFWVWCARLQGSHSSPALKPARTTSGLEKRTETGRAETELCDPALALSVSDVRRTPHSYPRVVKTGNSLARPGAIGGAKGMSASTKAARQRQGRRNAEGHLSSRRAPVQQQGSSREAAAAQQHATNHDDNHTRS